MALQEREARLLHRAFERRAVLRERRAVLRRLRSESTGNYWATVVEEAFRRSPLDSVEGPAPDNPRSQMADVLGDDQPFGELLHRMMMARFEELEAKLDGEIRSLGGEP